MRPDHPVLKGKFEETVKKLREKLGDDGSGGIEQIISQGRKNWSIEEDGFRNLVSSRYEAMLATIGLFHENMGIIPYLKDKLGFTSDDILKIYQNIVVADPQKHGI